MSSDLRDNDIDEAGIVFVVCETAEGDYSWPVIEQLTVPAFSTRDAAEALASKRDDWTVYERTVGELRDEVETMSGSGPFLTIDFRA